MNDFSLIEKVLWESEVLGMDNNPYDLAEWLREQADLVEQWADELIDDEEV